MKVRAVTVSELGRNGSSMNGVWSAVKEERGNDQHKKQGIQGSNSSQRGGVIDIPRTLSSWVQALSSCWTSSGPTSVRCHASVHVGFAGPVFSAAGVFEFFFAALESLLRNKRENEGILDSELSDFSSAERRGQQQQSGMVIDDARRPN